MLDAFLAASRRVTRSRLKSGIEGLPNEVGAMLVSADQAEKKHTIRRGRYMQQMLRADVNRMRQLRQRGSVAPGLKHWPQPEADCVTNHVQHLGGGLEFIARSSGHASVHWVHCLAYAAASSIAYIFVGASRYHVCEFVGMRMSIVRSEAEVD